MKVLLEGGEPDGAQERVSRLREKVEVLEEPEEAEIYGDATREFSYGWNVYRQ